MHYSSLEVIWVCKSWHESMFRSHVPWISQWSSSSRRSIFVLPSKFLLCSIGIRICVYIEYCTSVLKTTKMTMARLLRSHNKMPFPVKDMAGVLTALDSITANRSKPDTTWIDAWKMTIRFDCSHPCVFLVFCDWRRRWSIKSVRGSCSSIMCSICWHWQWSRSIIWTNANHSFPYWRSLWSQRRRISRRRHFASRKSTSQCDSLSRSRSNRYCPYLLSLWSDGYYDICLTLGAFTQVIIRSIECRRIPVTEVKRGQSATFSIRPTNRKVLIYRQTNFSLRLTYAILLFRSF